ncbi:MAG TPA: OadG family protein [Thermoflexia bacterium]|nr:OadG family protein [Thermoflexia bacterium]
MSALLTEALGLTVVGMGMTFAALGVLVLGMYLLTMLTAEKKSAGKGQEECAAPSPIAVAPSVSTTDERYLAAVAAVAVAVSQAAPQQQRQRSQPGDQWGLYVRSQQLNARRNH